VIWQDWILILVGTWAVFSTFGLLWCLRLLLLEHW
jgi:hypothetical protein